MNCPSEPLPGLPGGLPALERLFDRHGLPPTGRKLVLDALQGDPVRRVGGGRGNVAVRYPSRKMGVVIQAESRNVELAFVHRCESDPAVDFYLCQPATLSVYVIDTRGRRPRVQHVPDYLVLDGDGFAFVECKSIDELARDADRPSPRFVRDGDRWRWPAAEEAAAELGLAYRIFSSEDVNPIWIRNLRFLSDFAEVPKPSPDELQTLVDSLARARSLRLTELSASPGLSTETVWWAVAHRRVWCDLERDRVFEPDHAWVHDSESRMLAHRRLRAPDHLSSLAAAFVGGSAGTVRVEPGASLVWDGVPWNVLNRGPDTVTLRCEDGSGRVVPLSVGDVERLLQGGALRGSDSAPGFAAARDAVFRRASTRDLDQARARWEAVTYFNAHAQPPPGVSARSVRRFLRWARDGERRYGSALAGLIRFRGRRPGTAGLGSAQAQILREVVEVFADDRRAGRVQAAYARLVALCAERDVHPPPSERTLRRALQEGSLPDLERARRGSRAAYQVEGPSTAGGPLFPPHGDRVFEVGHIDHTPLDVRLVSSLNGTPLGSPWLTLLMDAYSRAVLAFCLSFDAPSRASVLSVLHDCVRRHSRVPDTLVFDQGPEFNSNDVEAALAYLRVSKVERPARKARFGAVVERMFGTTNTAFVHGSWATPRCWPSAAACRRIATPRARPCGRCPWSKRLASGGSSRSTPPSVTGLWAIPRATSSPVPSPATASGSPAVSRSTTPFASCWPRPSAATPAASTPCADSSSATCATGTTTSSTGTSSAPMCRSSSTWPTARWCSRTCAGGGSPAGWLMAMPTSTAAPGSRCAWRSRSCAPAAVRDGRRRPSTPGSSAGSSARPTTRAIWPARWPGMRSPAPYGRHQSLPPRPRCAWSRVTGPPLSLPSPPRTPAQRFLPLLRPCHARPPPSSSRPWSPSMSNDPSVRASLLAARTRIGAEAVRVTLMKYQRISVYYGTTYDSLGLRLVLACKPYGPRFSYASRSSAPSVVQAR